MQGEIEKPGHDHGKREPCDCKDDEQRQRPVRQVQRLEGHLGHLQHDPGDDRVGGRRLGDLAAPQFFNVAG